MAIGAQILVWLRYKGTACAHDLLLRAAAPAYSNADQGAEDAAGAFAEGALAHLRAWWETWRLPSLCAAGHTAAEVARGDDRDVGDHEAALELPGFRWLDLPLGRRPDGRLVLGPPAPAVPTYLLCDTATDGDLRDG